MACDHWHDSEAPGVNSTLLPQSSNSELSAGRASLVQPAKHRGITPSHATRALVCCWAAHAAIHPCMPYVLCTCMGCVITFMKSQSLYISLSLSTTITRLFAACLLLMHVWCGGLSGVSFFNLQQSCVTGQGRADAHGSRRLTATCSAVRLTGPV